MKPREVQALHVCGDFAVRAGVTLVIFADDSRLTLFDSFKPAAGYSTYWFVIKPGEGGVYWHVDVRDILPDAEPIVRHAPTTPGLKMQAFRDLLVARFGGAPALLDAAIKQAVIVGPQENDLTRARRA